MTISPDGITGVSVAVDALVVHVPEDANGLLPLGLALEDGGLAL